jgi:hypothetical protein
VQSARARGANIPRRSQGMSTAEQRIRTAAKRHDVEVSESGWRDLSKGGGKDRKR